MADQLEMFDCGRPRIDDRENVVDLYRDKRYSRIDSDILLIIHRALCHKMLTTDIELLGPEYDVRLKEVSAEMLRRVVLAGVELVP